MPVFAEEPYAEFEFNPLESRQLYFLSDEGRPAEALLETGEYETYQHALNMEDCDQAYALLANAYSHAYPTEPHPGESTDIRIDWQAFILFSVFPELAFCLEWQEMQDGIAEIRATGTEFERLGESHIFGSEPPREPWTIIPAFHGLIILLKRHYPPVYLAMMQLSEEGLIFRFAPNFQYYLLLAARKHGVDEPELDELISRSEAQLDEVTISDIKQRLADEYFGDLDPLFEQ